MWAIFTTALRSIWSKAGLYVIATAGLFVALATVASYLISSGKTTEKLKQAKVSLDTVRKEKQVEADNARLSAGDARRRLSEKWGRH